LFDIRHSVPPSNVARAPRPPQLSLNPNSVHMYKSWTATDSHPTLESLHDHECTIRWTNSTSCSRLDFDRRRLSGSCQNPSQRGPRLSAGHGRANRRRGPALPSDRAVHGRTALLAGGWISSHPGSARCRAQRIPGRRAARHRARRVALLHFSHASEFERELARGAIEQKLAGQQEV
jgi:hypothetical protein